MSNLSNLHISGSYKGLINLADSTQPLVSQSGDINLQDGLGDNVGLKINAQTKKFTIVNNLQVDGNTDLNGNLDVSGSFVHSGSIDIAGNVTINGNLSANVGTFDTINTRLLHVTEESSSVIFSSGSNVLGDENSDTQTLNGSVYIPFKEFLSGSTRDTETRLRDLTTFTASQESINSGYNSFTASVDTKFGVLQTYTASVDSSLASLNSFTSSANISINAINSFTSSANQRLNSLEAFTASLVTDFVSTATFNAFTQSTNQSITSLENFSSSYYVDSASFDTRIDSKLDTSTFTTFSSSVDGTLSLHESEINALIAATGSYVTTTGNNTFVGDQTISGSVNGNVEDITIASSTASIDCGTGNFFRLSLPAGTTHLTATNIIPGQTISLRVSTQSGRNIEIDNSTIKFPVGLEYVPSVSSSYDVLTFVTFDSNELLGVSVNLYNQ